jgi:hypothetical protein
MYLYLVPLEKLQCRATQEVFYLDRACDEIRMEIQTENSFQKAKPNVNDIDNLNEIKSDDRY